MYEFLRRFALILAFVSSLGNFLAVTSGASSSFSVRSVSEATAKKDLLSSPTTHRHAHECGTLDCATELEENEGERKVESTAIALRALVVTMGYVAHWRPCRWVPENDIPFTPQRVFGRYLSLPPPAHV